MISRQRGISFVSLVVVGGLVAFLGIIGVQIAPTVSEYFTIQKAVRKAATGMTVQEVRDNFDKATAIDQIRSISAKDLVVTKENGRVVVSFAYQREIHLFGPAYLLLKYEGSSR